MPNHFVQIRLSPQQIRKLKNMLPISVKAADVAHPAGVAVQLSEAKVKKLAAAKRKGKGMRLTLNQNELAGSGFMDVVKSVYNGAKTVAKDLYENRNEVRDGLVSALEMAKQLKELVAELRGEGMSDSQIKKTMLQLGFSKQELQGSGLFDDLGKAVKQARKGVHSVANVAQFVPVVGQPISMLDKGLTIADSGLDAVKHIRGKGCCQCCHCSCHSQGSASAPAPRQEGMRRANTQYADFYEIVMLPKRGSGLRLAGEGLTLP